VFDPLGISYFQESARYHLDKLSDPVLVFKHAPSTRRNYQGVSVSINALGLRDRELAKKDDELRVLLLGDSVTFGWGVPIEATFGRKLERTLRSKTARRVRTINTGVGGYNTVQEYAVLKTYADAIEPDVVVLLYVGNDIESNEPPFDPWSEVSLRGKTPPQAIALLLWKSWLYRLLRFAFEYRFASRSSHSNAPAPADRNARGVEESMDALSAIARFCRERAVHFVTFFYRMKSEPLSNLFLKVQTIGETYGFSVVDVGSWWNDVDARAVTNSTVDSHPNERGHEVLASGMSDFLMAHGLVDKRPSKK
jgi:lysophospholipase L1-like esterase